MSGDRGLPVALALLRSLSGSLVVLLYGIRTEPVSSYRLLTSVARFQRGSDPLDS